MSSAPPSAGPGLRVVRLGGVPVYIGSSWLILAVVIVGMTMSNLGGPSALSLGVGVGYAVALLVAVLVHEAAHALTARAVGLPVHRVVADLWGGHTAYDSTKARPGTSAAVAVAGPVANLLLAGLGRLVQQVLVDAPVAYVIAGGFAYANLLLAGFNLLPGLPLDGGQLVDSAVWKATGRRSAGLVAAGWTGRVVAVGVVLWFVVRPLLGPDRPSLAAGFWMLLIAWFLWRGATEAIHHGRAREILSGTRVGQVSTQARVVPADTPVGSLRALPWVAVARDETGVPSLVRFGDDASVPDTTPLASVVTRLPEECVVECTAADDLLEVVRAMQSTRVGTCVLTTGGEVWGVTEADRVNAALSGGDSTRN